MLDPEQYRSYLARPERLRGRTAADPDKRVVVVDEIQKVPSLLDDVHQVIETDRAPKFILMSSSSRKRTVKSTLREQAGVAGVTSPFESRGRGHGVPSEEARDLVALGDGEPATVGARRAPQFRTVTRL